MKLADDCQLPPENSSTNSKNAIPPALSSVANDWRAISKTVPGSARRVKIHSAEPAEFSSHGAAGGAFRFCRQNDLHGLVSGFPNSNSTQNIAAVGRSNNPPSNQNATTKTSAPARQAIAKKFEDGGWKTEDGWAKTG